MGRDSGVLGEGGERKAWVKGGREEGRRLGTKGRGKKGESGRNFSFSPVKTLEGVGRRGGGGGKWLLFRETKPPSSASIGRGGPSPTVFVSRLILPPVPQKQGSQTVISSFFSSYLHIK